MIVCDKAVVGPWVMHRVHGLWNPAAMETIGWEREGEITAGVVFENWNGVSMMVHIAADKPLTRGFVYRICDYAFSCCGKVIAPIAESNEKSITLVEKLGFRKVRVKGLSEAICTIIDAPFHFS